MDERTAAPILQYATRPMAYGRRLFVTYAWLILKNFFGWLLILLSGPIGLALPGPGGLPLFLIGFTLISFPGKRRLTARVIRGKPIPKESRAYLWATAIACTVAPFAFLTYVWFERNDALVRPILRLLQAENGGIIYFAYYIVLAIGLWLFLWPGRWIINLGLQLVARVRRKVRPFLRRQGFDLLPARRRRRRLVEGGPDSREPDDQDILQIDERHYRNIGILWNRVKPWLVRALGVAITGAIFFWMAKPVIREWPTVRESLLNTSPLRFALAAIMFAMFLAFRAISWRRILIGLGHRVPFAPVIRVWSTSELARYLPGAVWQVIGRVYLIKPYGVSGSVSSTSQILELAVFLLANMLVAAACFAYFGLKVHEQTRIALYACGALVPALVVLLHPRVFYGLVGYAMRKMGKPELPAQMDGWALVRMLSRIVGALLWQSVAVFLLVQPVLGLKVDHWWTVAGAYCLAWCAGFLAFWAPGGIGVRELVFVGAMEVVLPTHLATYGDAGERTALLTFLAILLRLWTIVGELLLAGTAYLLDYRGALNLPDAKGRVATEQPAS